jgi:hypothetical protein
MEPVIQSGSRLTIEPSIATGSTSVTSSQPGVGDTTLVSDPT